MTDHDDLTPRQRRYRHQVAAAKASSAAKRVRAALPTDRLEAFAVRDSQRFRWEIRRYGGIVVVSGAELFRSAAEAQFAGEAALSVMMIQSAL